MEEILKQILGGIKDIKQDVGNLKQDVGVLKQDVGNLKQDVSSLKQDIGVLKQDVGVLKQDVGILKEKVENLASGQDEMYRILRGLEENVSVTRAIAVRNDEMLNYLEGSIKKHDAKIDNIENSLSGMIEWIKDKQESDTETKSYLLEKVGQHDIDIRLIKRKLVNY
ncbi:hypothetical protein IT084_05735 [Desulfallas sp. Bu1-1]|uniref:hypothetical protein n=1 Tax=Desulfallas sp. Bu1-1 TaxID=2787620 RepID=UPI00189CB1CA|nr:hypothetical protein [Desulfallas sp. Bu1-1]MBF7082479.1 hypothetical protein [Desulfallas sp. Bu1-1]